MDTFYSNIPSLFKTALTPQLFIPTVTKSALDVRVSEHAIVEVSERFLSFSVDFAHVVGGSFWGAEGAVDRHFRHDHQLKHAWRDIGVRRVSVSVDQAGHQDPAIAINDHSCHPRLNI